MSLDLLQSMKDLLLQLEDVQAGLGVAPLDGEALAELADLSERAQDRLMDLMARLSTLRAQQDQSAQ